ncbi:MAG: 3-isopropylmalate dehydratase large subunit [Candidatus Caenarcaniphilales bacterium]|nr:3-isopropylmalate dehydratase large subunit [Candidatus Caenarcaniphilales bacterium]
MGQNLFNKVWSRHAVRELPSGQTQLFIGLHLIHEVTSPQAFGMIRSHGLTVPYPQRTFATVDHIIPTDTRTRPFKDNLAEDMIVAIKQNCEEFGIKYFSVETGQQGIVHVIGPELGLTQPGMTIACGDSHTSTHGAFGAIAFGIGTSQLRDVLATQTLALSKLKVRRIEIEGELSGGVYAKDVILHIIRLLGAKGGIGYAYEYAGSTIEALSMEERMTICNMSIEGGARVGYVNPDQTTYDYLKGRAYAPQGEAWDKAIAYWESIKSDLDATYEDVLKIKAEDISPTVTWGINPGQAIAVDENIPDPNTTTEAEKSSILEALDYMKFRPSQPIQGTKINVAFIGSCTNGRLSDIEEVARVIQGKKVAPGVRALVVPGSMQVKEEAEKKGLDKVIRDAGFEWREAGCSMCLAMNPDKLQGDEICASSSNRNFKGRQGSPTGRTLLMSPVMVAAAALTGEISDAREVFRGMI